MYLIRSLQGHVTSLAAAGAVSAHFGEPQSPGIRERIVLAFALLDDGNVIGLVEHDGLFANAELPGFSGYGPVRFYEPR